MQRTKEDQRDVIFQNWDSNTEKYFTKKQPLLNLSQYSEEFNQMNKTLRDQEMQKKVLKELNDFKEALKEEKERTKALETIIDRANEKCTKLQKGMIEVLENSAYYYTQERYKKEITRLEKKVQSLEERITTKLPEGIRKRNMNKEGKVFIYLAENHGIISNYRSVSKELKISLSTLHKIVKRFYKENSTCSDCGSLLFITSLYETHYSKDSIPIRVPIKYYLCMKCALNPENKDEIFFYKRKETTKEDPEFKGKWIFTLEGKSNPSWIPKKYRQT